MKPRVAHAHVNVNVNVEVKWRDTRRKAFWVVDDFEDELAAYCGSRFAVATDSCTNAIFLSLLLEKQRRYIVNWFNSTNACPPAREAVRVPAFTYVGVLQAVLNAGFRPDFDGSPWEGSYRLSPTRVVDAARDLRRGVHTPGDLTCLSFHAGKQLPLGRGGAILLDDEDDFRWLRAARMDGRTEGDNTGAVQPAGWHCFMQPPDAARALWMLVNLEDEPAERDHAPYPDLRSSGLA